MLYPSVTLSPRRQAARKIVALFLVVGAFFALTACDSLERFASRSQRTLANFFTFSDHEEYTAQELALNGMEAYEAGNYRAAARNFQELKDFYPFSQYAALADLKLGDSYYERRQYAKAIQAYEDFEALHPRNEAIPYVIYKIGMSYYQQMPSMDRDQSKAEKAMETFLRLQRQFPGDPYAIMSEPLVPECIRKLAGHEFSIGLFYFETKHFISAKQRFEKVLRNYPDVGYHREAMIYLVDCERRIKEQEEQLKIAEGQEIDTLAVPDVRFPTIGEEDLLDLDAPTTDAVQLPGTHDPAMTEDIEMNSGAVYPDF